ncbi:MAG: hypothetical protein COY40_01530 [Alphaproteobacteria bacterium CG_4_10_14_0_8_um_filter_53_9]|nr:MAG: hypothetical protein COY40_01530 [Alphaproteobacteria bacterium CG_4_10_14_0_8_um_filter_53_9]
MADYAPGVIAQMIDARTTCRELAKLLLEENHALHKGGAAENEARLNLKKRLSVRLEKLVQDIKGQRDKWHTNALAARTANELAADIAVFTDLARKNELMLRAAHQIRADIVGVIRDAMDAQSPRVQTYGRSGTMNTSSAGVRVLAKEV